MAWPQVNPATDAWRLEDIFSGYSAELGLHRLVLNLRERYVTDSAVELRWNTLTISRCKWRRHDVDVGWNETRCCLVRLFRRHRRNTDDRSAIRITEHSSALLKLPPASLLKRAVVVHSKWKQLKDQWHERVSGNNQTAGNLTSGIVTFGFYLYFP